MHDMAIRAADSPSCPDCAIRDSCTLKRLRGHAGDEGAPRVRERVFHRGDVLLAEGARSAVVRVVKLGTVFGYRRGLDGRSRPIGVVKRGTALGLFGTLELPNQTSCVALSTVRVCETGAAGWHGASDCGSRFLLQLGQAVADMFAAVTAWSEAMRLPGTVNQLAYVLMLLADANQSAVVELPSHAALAELLGTRRETIARTLRLLENEGGIRRHERKRCEIDRSSLLARLSHGSA